MLGSITGAPKPPLEFVTRILSEVVAAFPKCTWVMGVCSAFMY